MPAPAIETPGYRFLHVRPEFVVLDRGSHDPDLILNGDDAPDAAGLVFSCLACGVEVDGAGEGDNGGQSPENCGRNKPGGA